MKVLLIDVNCKNSSTGKIVYDLYSHINSVGDEAAICYGRGKKISEKNVFKFGLDVETYIHALLTRLTGYTGCFSPFSTRRLLKFIKKFKPDVVHIHELHAYFVNIKPLLRYLAKNKIKTVMTLHCEFAYTGKCGHSVECENWKTECKNCPRLHDYPASLFFDHTTHMFNQKKKLFKQIEDLTIVAPSSWLAERAKQSIFADREIKVVHNGIDTEIFSPKETSDLKTKHDIADCEKVVLALAPNLMSSNKGGKYVLQLADMMKEKKVRFIMIGVDGEYVSENENVIILPRIYDKVLLAKYYSLADAFLICSERENFPTTCLEAQCCGTPVCGFDVGGVRETAFFDNLVVEYGDLEALKVAVSLALSEDKKITEISKTAFEKFDKSMMVSSYLNLYFDNNGG